MVSVAALLCVGHPACGATRFVRASAAGANNGTSWNDAFTALPPAITAAVAGDEVWVAAGTYTPTGPARTSSFLLKNGVKIRGGFAGFETALSQRNISGNPTILSGDFAGNDTPNFGNRADNAYNVVTGTNINSAALLEGFIIRGGQADNSAVPALGVGAGMSVTGGQATVRACVFRDNFSIGGGSALDMIGSSFRFSDVLIYANRNANGSAVRLQNASTPSFDLCTIANNTTAVNNAVAGVFVLNIPGTVTFNGTIIWDNRNSSAATVQAQVQIQSAPLISITNCDIGGASVLAGAGNFNADPRFESVLGPDGIAGTGDEGFKLTRNSPCIDHVPVSTLPADTLDMDGDANTAEALPLDLGWFGRSLDDFGTPNQPGTTVDVGAFEFPGTSCLADLTFDGLVNTADLTAFLAAFGTSGIVPLAGDLNADGAVNTTDLTTFLSSFGTNCNN
jgi:hypothetical protein